MTPIVRRATADDLARFYSAHPTEEARPTVTAWCGELDGEIIAVGGFAHVGGKVVAFFQEDDKARRYKIALVKAARRAMTDIAERHRIVFAQTDPKEPGAKRWVKSLGFTETEFSGIYKWRRSDRS